MTTITTFWYYRLWKDIPIKNIPLLNILKGGWVTDHAWFAKGCISDCKNNGICMQACIIPCKTNVYCIQGVNIRCKNNYICMMPSWNCCRNNAKYGKILISVPRTSFQVLSSTVPAHKPWQTLLIIFNCFDAVLLQNHQNHWFWLRRFLIFTSWAIWNHL